MEIKSPYSAVRVGDAPEGATPFRKKNGMLHFDPQNFRKIDYGHMFDQERGYRVYFKFADSNASNSWDPTDLLRWAQSTEIVNDEVADFVATCQQQARQCKRLNRLWKTMGRPENGVPMDAKGSA
ncbi:MAG: hypothetical protein AAF468_20645 [Pseudomonadota bacterium]